MELIIEERGNGTPFLFYIFILLSKKEFYK
nr:MAG TPA: hypothetical protein [Caudoviricetes sp.]